MQKSNVIHPKRVGNGMYEPLSSMNLQIKMGRRTIMYTTGYHNIFFAILRRFAVWGKLPPLRLDPEVVDGEAAWNVNRYPNWPGVMSRFPRSVSQTGIYINVMIMAAISI
jgi:hypothetical protein